MTHLSPSRLLKCLSGLALGACLTACGDNNAELSIRLPEDVPGMEGETGTLVLKSRALIHISTSPDLPGHLNPASASIVALAGTANGSTTVTVQNSASTSFALDNASWTTPSITNTVLSFGSLAVGSLMDNDLKNCGDKGKSRCGHAYIRMYTTGTKLAGFYNVEDQYGAPITAGLAGTDAKTLGLDAAGSVIVQSYVIPNNQNVLRHTDFAPAPRYEIKSDFTNAGAGAYSTTLVVEYLLGT
jgi:hypothetical protein